MNFNDYNEMGVTVIDKEKKAKGTNIKAMQVQLCVKHAECITEFEEMYLDGF
mgnify:CR=1 FL=1|jgi:hypothetical protein